MGKSIFKQPSPSQSHFAAVPSADIQRSRFDRSSGYKTTADAGFLYPVFCDEVLPGDSFHMKATNFSRLSTPLRPLMDNLKSDIHFFFVPSRLVWENFTKFMGERPTPDFDPNTLTVPVLPLQYGTSANADDLACRKVAEYFGLPFKAAPQASSKSSYVVNVNSLPFRAYNLIYSKCYRDWETDRKSTRLNSSHSAKSRMPSSA